jgi:alcohol dehydrogenase (cytochrome c)
VMFVATPGNQMLAIEAKTGNILWRYKRTLPEDVVHLHPTNRGVALYGDKVYFASADCVLVALDAKTGKEVWTAKVDDYKKAFSCRKNCLLLRQLTFGQTTLSHASRCRLMSKHYC